MKLRTWSKATAMAGLGMVAGLTVAGCGGSDQSDFTGPGPGGATGAGGGAAGTSTTGKGGSGANGGSVGKGGAAGSPAGGGMPGKGGTGGTGKGGTGGMNTGGTNAGGKGGTGGAATGGTSGKGGASGKGGTGGAATGGTGTAGSGTAGKGTAGTGTAGSGTGGSGTAGSGTAGSGTAGTGTAGSGTAGTGTAGSGTAGTGTAGSGTAGSGTAGSGTAGSGTAGSGTAGTGGAPGCSPNGSACTTAGSNNGLCASAVCIDCVDPTDDAACTAAYGGAELCLAGSCTPGNCRIDSDCSSAKDVCSNHNCIPCDAVGSTFIVDPINGDDAKATGSGTAGGVANSACAFKTVTAAIAAVMSPSSATTIEIIGPSFVHGGETFPLVVPVNTTVTSSGGLVTVLVPTAKVGFAMPNKVSKIDGGSSGITIDGQGAAFTAGSPQVGVSANAGSNLTTVLANVTIQALANQGIAVGNNAGITVEAGVKVTTSGQPPTASGLGIFAVQVGDGMAQLSSNIAAGASPFLIEGNKGGGMAVAGVSTVSLTGVPGAAVGTGSILVAANGGPGMDSRPFGGSTTLDGVVFYQNGAAAGGMPHSGVRVTSGTKFTMRNSVSLANGAHGVHILPSPNLGSIGGIDLGGGNGTSGLNLLQDPANANTFVGICFDAGFLVAQTLLAKGNIFGASNCSTTAAVLANGTACAKAGDVGIIQPALGTNSINVTMCSYP